MQLVQHSEIPRLVEASLGVVSVARFGIRPDDPAPIGDLAQEAVLAVMSAGAGGLYWPPGLYHVDPAATIIVPSGFTSYGTKRRSVLKALGENFADAPSFPHIGQAIMAVGDPLTRLRYGTETGRSAAGAGAVFTFTTVAGVVTAVSAITAIGAGYTLGEKLLFPNGTSLYVTGLNGTGVGSVLINTGGSGWVGGSSAGQVQTNTTGQNPDDRIFDLSSFADECHFSGLTFDGGYGWKDEDGNVNPRLTGSKALSGLVARGVLNVSVTDCSFENFPDTGCYLFDCQNAIVRNNRANDCGWAGVLGHSRNGFSNVGLYSTQQPELNTEYWIFSDNVARKIGDVGAQFSNVDNAQITRNQLLGCGTIGIEGESASFACWSTYAGNNGIRPPGDATITDNTVNGLMLDGTLATDRTGSGFNAVSIYAFNGISWTQGNEGEVVEGRNKISNLTGAGLKIIRNSGGQIKGLGGTRVVNVSQANNPAAKPVAPGFDGQTQATGAASTAGQQGVLLTAAEVTWNRSYVDTRYVGQGILVSPAGGFLSADVTDNYVAGASADTASPAIHFRLVRSNACRTLDFSRNRLDSPQAAGVQIEVAGGGNTASFASIRADGCTVRGGNRSNIAGTAGIRITSSGGGVLNFLVATADGLVYLEPSLSANAAIPVVMDNTNTSAANLVSVSGMVAPQFATKQSLVPAIAPAATRLVNNV